MPTKLVLVVRSDLGMGKGKIAAQVAHAAVAAALRNQDTTRFAAWLRDGQPKVVLKIDGADRMRDLCTSADAAGLPLERIHDAGRTQVVPGTLTCCAIGPALDEELDPVVQDLSLL
ncbi:MAG TPA: peptidyl-tRNA hydrolase Pth2 [Jiangellaceae bacterium]|nr:peptidyl-tRNA hydrolase Pth2 [Jiangellaceae bacterium]